MRIVNGVLAVLLVLFATAQYNDPDGVFWMAVYGGGAIWCALAALRPMVGANGAVKAGFGACLVAAIGGMFWFWPEVTDWWDIDVWWPEITGETSREGMGMMVLVICLIAAGVVMLRSRRV